MTPGQGDEEQDLPGVWMKRLGSRERRVTWGSTQLWLLAAAKCNVVPPVPQFPYLRTEADFLGRGVQEAEGLLTSLTQAVHPTKPHF